MTKTLKRYDRYDKLKMKNPVFMRFSRKKDRGSTPLGSIAKALKIRGFQGLNFQRYDARYDDTCVN